MGFTVDDTGTSNYVKKGQVGEEGIVAKIVAAQMENVAQQGQPKEMKGVLTLQGQDLAGEPLKPLICNKTNATTLHVISGSDSSDDWIGLEVVLYNDTRVSFTVQGVTHYGGIRIKEHSTDPGRQIPTTPVSEDGPPIASEADVANPDSEISY